MEALRIVLLCVVAAVVYGIAQDQVTARVCVEYFTIGHPRVVDSESPTVLAFVWGVLATGWVGAGLGVLLAVAARAGSRPTLRWTDLVRPVAVLLLSIAVVAALGGVVGWRLALAGRTWLLEPLASAVPKERHVPFLADLWAHVAAYAAGGVGGLVLAIRTWRLRGRLSRASPRTDPRPAG